MKKIMSLFVIGAVTASVSTASAAEFSLFGILDSRDDDKARHEKILNEKTHHVRFVSLEQLPPAPTPIAAEGQPPAPQPQPQPQPAELFPHVKYKDLDEVAPCAVPMIVQVPDPCACRDRCHCCQPSLVNVKICVPEHCCPPRVKVKRKGREYVYDFGDYHVDVRLKKKGYIEVDYQD